MGAINSSNLCGDAGVVDFGNDVRTDAQLFGICSISLHKMRSPPTSCRKFLSRNFMGFTIF